MGYFPIQKDWFFGKMSNQHLQYIQFKAKGEPLQRKTPQFFSQKTLTCAIWSKAEEELESPSFLYMRYPSYDDPGLQVMNVDRGLVIFILVNEHKSHIAIYEL